MTTKELILQLLEQNREDYLSGEYLARRAHVSRTAVWKAIRSLREDGHLIRAVTNRGYLLTEEKDRISAEAIAAGTAGLPLQIEVRSSVTGTNALLKAAAAQGAPEGTVLIAEHQTEGHGRYGRSFYSPQGTGVYLSLILRPKVEAGRAQQITAMAAVAAAKAAKELTGEDYRVKWVNDLLKDGKKVAGILTEAALSFENGGLDYAVLGIGFNIAPPEGGWPEELASIAGSLFPGEAPLGTRTALCIAFLKAFWPICEAFDPDAFLPEYAALQEAIGKEIDILSPGKAPERAAAVGIDETCGLIVRMPDGTKRHLNSGEVRIRL